MMVLDIHVMQIFEIKRGHEVNPIKPNLY